MHTCEEVDEALRVARASLQAAEERITELEKGLREIYDDYKALADSGDCGNWKLEEQRIGLDTLALLQGADK